MCGNRFPKKLWDDISSLPQDPVSQKNAKVVSRDSTMVLLQISSSE